MSRATRTDRLNQRERLRLLGLLEKLRDVKPSRKAARVDAELKEIRGSRHAGGRRDPVT